MRLREIVIVNILLRSYDSGVCGEGGGGGVSYSPFYLDDGEGHTIPGEPIAAGEMAELSHDFLQLLGLTRKPRPVHVATLGSASQFLFDVYSRLADPATGVVRSDSGALTDGFLLHPASSPRSSHTLSFNMSLSDQQTISKSDVIISFVNHGHPLSAKLPFSSEQLLWFDVTEMPPGQKQLTSVLRVYQTHSQTLQALSPAVQLTLSTNLIMIGENKTYTLHQLDKIVLDSFYTGWLMFNVTAATDLWTVLPDYNLGLYLQLLDANGIEWSVEDAGIVATSGVDFRQPFMTAFLKQYPDEHGAGLRLHFDIKSRHKRTARQKNQNKRRRSSVRSTSSDIHHPLASIGQRSEQALCHKQNLYVSFRSLGWEDWIIAPEGYAAFYCSGLCEFPLNSHMNATNHAIVQTLTHLLEPFRYPKPSCAPTTLSGISVLYFDDNSNVILKKYQNMVATNCGCH